MMQCFLLVYVNLVNSLRQSSCLQYSTPLKVIKIYRTFGLIKRW